MHDLVVKDDVVSCVYFGRSFEFDLKAIAHGGDEVVGQHTTRGTTYPIKRQSSHISTLAVSACNELKKSHDREAHLLDIVFQTYRFMKHRGTSTILEIETKQRLRDCVEAFGTDNQKKGL